MSDVLPSVDRVRRVVGLYGDPSVSWSIALEVEIADPPDEATLIRRAAEIVAAHPHLGIAPTVDEHRGAATLQDFGDRLYGDRDPLVRIAVGADRLLVAAHHGAIDGLGLIGLIGLLTDRPLGCSATGVSRTGAEPGFLRGNLQRVGEALWRPPTRFQATAAERGAVGDVYAAVAVPAFRGGTAALAWASTRALAEWNRGSAQERRRTQPVVALGVSRRSGAVPLAPDRDTAYTRIRARGVDSPAAMTEVLRATPPEPDFPLAEPRRVDPVRMVTRALGGRLGSTLLVSNLGLLRPAESGVTAARIWPAPAGPNGVAVGLTSASAGEGVQTQLTVRMRRGWFAPDASQRLADLLLDGLGRQLPR
ncbi:hypothetical protein [Nocardioides sambongensis]|uniref:hypothetical protein n=1 Tax=Nocardioides sambongensis TaxID=2589074 RepID=UPI00112B6A03|nr:hypothetical protein [Nocardioides sambongensis]